MFRDQFCNPKSNLSVRNCSTLSKGAESGLTCLPAHQLLHLDQAELLCVHWFTRTAEVVSSVSCSENPCVKKAYKMHKL